MKTFNLRVGALLIIAAGLNGCATAYVREWNSDQITACGNRNANRELIEQKAREQCGGDVSLIGGRLVNTGTAYVGYGVFTEVNHNCLVFRCPASAAPREPAEAVVIPPNTEPKKKAAFFDQFGL